MAKKSIRKKSSKKTAGTKRSASKRNASGPVLLSGGNPQIPKGEGDAPGQAYIRAMPGWKHKAGKRLDQLIEQTVPGVRKAVKWNSPFYGDPDQPGTWFLAYHCFTKYIKVTFFRGTSMIPVPPEQSKTEGTRYLHIHEDEEFDEDQFVDWVKQASDLPGEKL